LGRVEKLRLDGGEGMVKLIMYGTYDDNTLTGTYGPAVRLGRAGSANERWKFERGAKREKKAVRATYAWGGEKL